VFSGHLRLNRASEVTHDGLDSARMFNCQPCLLEKSCKVDESLDSVLVVGILDGREAVVGPASIDGSEGER